MKLVAARRTGPIRSPVRCRFLAVGLLLLPCLAAPVLAQNPGDGVRVGLTLGGISSVGVVVELYRGSRSLDLTLGTFSFRDVGVAVSAKQYIGSGAVRGFVGAGLWLVLASPPDERTGAGLVARLPVGVDWRVSGDHAIGLAVALNRALAVRRPDPTDDRPMNRGLVPLPGLYYRWDTGS